ncbi:hypothetical protein BMS3Abin15_00319 [bacterium BMS3Abin15]|nr:hypothetical protein BMS3Abin15_00319 [bacterium BMS3Abin15]HDZ85088.1 prepilin-type N-terminal cleavage/methylation domain-containing protein [Candidatus Moranbacteria bacterium]
MVNKNKKGMTLIEAIVAIAIFVIGMEGFVLLFTKSWQMNSFTLETGMASFIASRGVQTTINVIRNARQADNGAFTIVSANDNDLVIYSDIDGDSTVERVHYYLDNGNFKVGVTEPTDDVPPIYPVGDQTVSDTANYVVNNAEAPIFSYYDIDNNLLATPAVVNNVKMAKVYLEVNIDPIRTPNNIVIQSYASIRNLSEYDRSQ